jgi:selenocysteine lyase/cysteine desulfurase
LVKEAVGAEFILERCAELRRRAVDMWRQEDRIDLLGPRDAAALPILSFRVKDDAGGFVHHQLVTRLLSDHFGVQARGGCACAGPYAHRLLGLSRERSDELDQDLAGGAEFLKPGWTRLNLSYLMDDAKADFVIAAVMQVAREAPKMARAYLADPATARFSRVKN